MKILGLALIGIGLSSCENSRTFDESEIPVSNAIIAAHELGKSNEVDRISYVPIYSNLLYHDNRHLIALHSTVSIRNLSLDQNLEIVSATYYDTNGKKIRELIEEPFGVKPLASFELVILEADLKGGSGAKILINWQAAKAPFPEPIVEAIFLGKRGSSEFAFSSRGAVVSK